MASTPPPSADGDGTGQKTDQAGDYSSLDAVSYSQPPFALEDLADTTSKPPLSTAPARLLDESDKLTCYRVERPLVAFCMAAEMKQRGILRLAYHTGNAIVLCADFKKQQDRAWMQRYPGKHTCRVSRRYHAACPLLFAAEPRMIGGKRGPCKGWTSSTKRTSRNYCVALAELGRIKGVLTIGPLPESAKLKSFQKAIHRLLKKWNIAHHGLWEGPNPHLHILLCSPVDEAAKKEIRENIFACYRRHFGCRPHPTSNLVDLDVELKKGPISIAKYCGKTRKRTGNGGGYVVKEQYVWLEWQPYFSHGLPMKRIREIIPTLTPTPREICGRAMNRKKWESSRSR